MDRYNKSTYADKLLLIVGVIALIAVTGCTSSGGGGSSSSPTYRTTPQNTTSNPAGTTITVGEEGTAGMVATGNDAAINEGEIIVDADHAAAMFSSSDNATLKNNGEIEVNGMDSTGMAVEGGIATNNNTISVNGISSSGISVSGSSGVNNFNIIVSSPSTGPDDASAAMEAEGATSSITNTATITLDSSYTSGMHVEDGATARNEGLITANAADSVGMTALEDAVLENTATGTINIYSSGMGIAAFEPGATAANDGSITLYMDSSIGMYGEDTTTIVNNGIINLESIQSVGMYVEDGATAVNYGTINLNSTLGIGLYGEGTGTTIENRGTILLSGSQVEAPYSADDTARFNGELINGLDSRDNVGMKVKNGARMINKGRIVFDGN